MDEEKKAGQPVSGEETSQDKLIADLKRQVSELRRGLQICQNRQKALEAEVEKKTQELKDAVENIHREKLIEDATEIYAIKQMIRDESRCKWKIWK